ncbi:MAG TPA: hypothetical protein VFS56_00955 [Gemmatimonadaceae bacterium]|nr:hypothetical protein [Gemmatimonadaceae bacterium]
MAELDIQQKGRSPWLWWVIGLIVLAVLLWWFTSMRDRDPAVGENIGAPVPFPMTDPGVATTAAGPITDLSTLAVATTADDLVGRQVSLNNVPVATVASDKGFWAGSGGTTGQNVFVVRGNQNASYTAPDGAVNAGRNVNVYGVVRAMPSDMTQQSTEWNLRSTDRDRLATRPLYVHADSVRIAR